MTEPDEQNMIQVEENSAEERMRAVVAECESKINEVTELVTRVRHEINNPLAAVLGQAQLLLREDLNDKARKRAAVIEELAMRLRDIVAQLRQVQRPLKNSDE